MANMTKALSATAFPKWRGEVDPETTLRLLLKDTALVVWESIFCIFSPVFKIT